jgi:hypothetical protein
MIIMIVMIKQIIFYHNNHDNPRSINAADLFLNHMNIGLPKVKNPGFIVRYVF